ncbi:MAG: hypothetical protein AAGA48_01700 [Myxococcota bacterium]
MLWIAMGLGCSPSADVTLAVENGDGYLQALGTLEHAITATEALGSSDWTRHARIADAHLAMARLTGRYEPYDAALAELGDAFSLAPTGGGPHETAAAVLFSLHRLPEARDALEQAWGTILLDDVTHARLWLLESQIAWQEGQLKLAEEAVEASLSLRPTYDALAARGHQRWHLGAYDAADADYVAAKRQLIDDAGQAAAWIEVQRGLMDLDRSRYDEALSHYLLADTAFPGWWLVHEHIAEVLALNGQPNQATALYEQVVAETGAPELALALAELQGLNSSKSRARLDDAEKAWTDVLARHPEAASGHAIEFFVAIGDLDRAQTLAQANVAARPGPASHVELASVHAVLKQWPEAREAAQTALATGFQTPDLLDLAADIQRALGDRSEARRLAQRAESLR